MGTVDESLKIIADKVKNHSDTMLTEEAVKTAVVLPFLRALGYDIFDPLEVIPEFTADAVGKKGEKVDYAIRIDGEIRILFECKPISCELSSKHLSQLYRYFSVTNAKFAILTNGRFFHFYTDLDAANKLDNRPFLTFDVIEYNTVVLTELKKFERSAFNIENILVTAEQLKYVSGIKQNIQKEIENPSEGFVRVACADVYEGRLTANVLEMLTGVTKNAFREVISDAVKSRLSSALQTTTETDKQDNIATSIGNEHARITTEEEVEGFMIVKAIAREVISADRIVIRDAKSYCAILIDNNNRKPLVRLHFNRKRKQLALFDTDIDEKVGIETLDNIYDFADRIRETAKKYL
ncbi:hypothetical protein BM1374166_00518 [Bartonella tribocorum]|uniref:Type I restriction enzyme R protein N-terminal domain-containing protein n=3 Tax=Bartonella TaxID=773 RepID=A9IQ26_BART1|nr:type I restriction endonuclease [Bartonella tribocorum]CAK01003.1 conserved hypothetical protein [Bartonella tribocorum CIP 105476]CDO48209.1 hypothetical protein BM1374166_00518 [Bartonella tribocorum]